MRARGNGTRFHSNIHTINDLFTVLSIINMITQKSPQKAPKATTTISVSAETHCIFRRLARLNDMTISSYLTHLAREAERCERKGEVLRAKLKVEDLRVDELLVKMSQDMDSLVKRKSEKDLFISFIRTQEREILNPMKADIEKLTEQYSAILKAIESIK